DEFVQEPDWASAIWAYEQDEAIEITISGFNKGGLLADWNGLPGFLPASQLKNFPECHVVSKRLKALSTWVGQEVRVKIIELDPPTNRLIFSERVASFAADERADVLNRIKRGDTLVGRVTNMAAFGVFVDLGGVEGLIHISELSWGRVVHPGDILTPGQEVKVVVLRVEPEIERIALSRKRLLSNPWDAVEERYHSGQIVQGVITNIAEFGAFAELEEGLEGLIHISEISSQQLSSPHEVLNKGDEVVARVLKVDGANHRLALSLKGTEGIANG
ncbi:MAG: S1 RNA-binding domain-containing protein, partial [Candidatus Promineifilaceae bacterium]